MNSKVASFALCLVFCVCAQALTTRSVTVPSPIKAIYIDWHLNWNAPHQSALDAVNAGYNVIIASFYLSSGTPADFAQAWAALDDTTKINTVNTMHAKGAVLLVSLGGSTDMPFDKDPTALGQQVGAWAKAQHMDGVDFDLENINAGFTVPGKTDTQLVDWLAALSESAYNAIGSGAIITHAPQGPYFGPVGATDGWVGPSGGYTGLYKKAGNFISFFHVQFYNQGGTCYSDYTSLFRNSGTACPPFPHTSVGEIAAGGVPLSKVVMGKPITQADASNGWVDGTTLASFVARAKSEIGWETGIMGWVWNEKETCGGFASKIFGNSGSHSGVTATTAATSATSAHASSATSATSASVSTTASAASSGYSGSASGHSSGSGSGVCAGKAPGMYCVDSTHFQYCPETAPQACGTGTVCKQNGNYIVCGFA
eukprot:Phypoly_transcript_07972.p1 GENE.Phypoly_transcript_07972~~Phypoly_transcript_07972.p1  ORF type:complete len:427 (+),score=78.21 Phypoly_transcript_07972:174-1454(+)